MSAGVMVRAAAEEDLAAVLELERAAAEAPHWTPEQYREALQPHGGSVRRCLLVAEVDGRVAGFAVGKVLRLGATGATGGVGELESVAVAGTVRRRGVGRALCSAVVEWCAEAGAAEMELEVRAGSAGAIALYEGLGFVATGLRKRYYSQPVEDGLLMAMRLREAR